MHISSKETVVFNCVLKNKMMYKRLVSSCKKSLDCSLKNITYIVEFDLLQGYYVKHYLNGDRDYEVQDNITISKSIWFPRMTVSNFSSAYYYLVIFVGIFRLIWNSSFAWFFKVKCKTKLQSHGGSLNKALNPQKLHFAETCTSITCMLYYTQGNVVGNNFQVFALSGNKHILFYFQIELLVPICRKMMLVIKASLLP